MADSKRYDDRMKSLQAARHPFWTHWREIADYILPRRYRWLVTPNELQQNQSMLNSRIIDSTGTVALRVLASGMMAGITSPTRPWFKLRMNMSGSGDESPTVSRWLAEVEQRMLRVFAESNFYNSMATLFLDLAAFGTAVNVIREDYEDVIRCFNSPAGEYYIANSYRLDVDTLYREFTMTVDQMVEQFGRERLSDTARSLADQEHGRAKEIIVGCAIEPNREPRTVAARFPFREVYWEKGQQGQTLAERGLFEKPFIAARWDLTSGEAYGRSPAMDALGDIKQLQQETKRKAQAIDKMVNPPMLFDVQLKNQPASLLPGGATYVSGLGNTVGAKPVYQVQPPVQELMLDIKEIQGRIQRIFFNDLFMMFQELQAEPRSAAAVDARREEKLIMLGPVLERTQNEALDVAIDRVFGIMFRGGLFPPPPAEIQGQHIKVDYVSMLAEAQRAVTTAGVERWMAQLGSIAGVKPEILDVPKWDEVAADYGTNLGIAPKLINSPEEIAAIRQGRAQALAAQKQQELTMAAVQGAETLSKTDVGGGQNALALMTGAGNV